MTPRKHQIEGASWALTTIRNYGLAYLSWKERTGKTLTAILTAEYSNVSSILIVTKKKAIPGWLETIEAYDTTKEYTVINYESVHKVPTGHNLIILDEAHHAISSFPKVSKTWKEVKKHTKDRPILYLSATPYAEHIGLIYNQLKLSNATPFKHINGYKFHKAYGTPHMTYTPYGLKETYTHFRTQAVFDRMKHLFNFKTRQDVGIKVEPTQRLVIVKPSERTKRMLKEWKETRVLGDLVGDSDSKVRTVHYQIEGGTVKGLGVVNTDKIDYIKANYCSEKIAIMAHFIAEREELMKHFPIVLSSDGDAEGVDLSHIDKLLIFSMSFKTSKHTQRVARQANHNRTKPIVVDILVMDKPGIGKAVYNTVAVKEQNFVKASYEASFR